MKKKIGQLIKEEVERQGLSPSQFADLVCTVRSNVYSFYNREKFDTDQLILISNALHRNFFLELYKDMAGMLGAAEPPATMANYKLKSLGDVINKEIDGCTYSFPKFSKNREGLKTLLMEYFESDQRIPLIILESGFTFGAREVVKQMAREAFHGCDSAPCPKMLNVSKVKVMPERVLVDYIDKNTYDSVEESNRRLNELCQIQKEVTKKFVCIIHTDPTVSITGADDDASFEQWGSEYKMMVSRFDQCFITVYCWDRESLLSWAVDNNLHEYVVNYIRNHHLKGGSSVDYQLSHIEVPMDQIFLGLRAVNEPADYPTAHTYHPKEWEFVSAFIREKRDLNETFGLRDFTLDIIEFNEGNRNQLKEQLEIQKAEQARTKKETKAPVLYYTVEVKGSNWKHEYISNTLDAALNIPSHIAAALPYLYSLALESDLKGLGDDNFLVEEKFYPWLKEHHPKVAQVFEDAADDYFNEQLEHNDFDGDLREYFPSVEVDYGCYGVSDSRVYNFIFYDVLNWKIEIVDNCN